MPERRLLAQSGLFYSYAQLESNRAVWQLSFAVSVVRATPLKEASLRGVQE
jgi:hypothetical protein